MTDSPEHFSIPDCTISSSANGLIVPFPIYLAEELNLCGSVFSSANRIITMPIYRVVRIKWLGKCKVPDTWKMYLKNVKIRVNSIIGNITRILVIFFITYRISFSPCINVYISMVYL